MIYGYARVSTPQQERDGNSLEAQRAQLTAAGAEEIFSDTFTGTKADRPELNKLMERLESGDTLLTAKIDRLGRSIVQVNGLVEELLKRGVTVHILSLGPMDDTPTGKLIRNIMLSFAEFERDMIVERTQEGKAIARQNPNYREGRRPKFTQAQRDHAMELLEKHTYPEVAKMTGISKATLCREAARRRAVNNS